jgi:hypothetical protein
MHFGRQNPKIKYKIDNTDLTIVASQVDLGVTVTQDISWTEQTNKAAWKAVGTLNLLKKKLPSPSHSLVSNLYSTYIRQHMEFAISLASPLQEKTTFIRKSAICSNLMVARFVTLAIRRTFENVKNAATWRDIR